MRRLGRLTAASSSCTPSFWRRPLEAAVRLELLLLDAIALLCGDCVSLSSVSQFVVVNSSGIHAGGIYSRLRHIVKPI
jgi:hypothetical protein